ncbi:hypothetical protein HQ403_01635, partial [Candidatus Kaiserbacteria bacterium]|nr:hypothetical protein [Candidatus Kaiserbacteria bacterium]
MAQSHELKKALALSILKDSSREKNENTATCITSSSGHSYCSGKIESDNHLLDISSEQGALIQAIHHNDFDIEHVTTLVESPVGIVSPLVLKILADFSVRTKKTLSYTVLDTSDNVLFETKDVARELSFYNPPSVELELLQKRTYSTNKITGATVDDLKKHALCGIDRNF